MVKIDCAAEIAEEIFRLQKLAEVDLLSNDRPARTFDALPDNWIFKFDFPAMFIDAEEHADFFEQLPHYRHPMAKRFIRFGVIIQHAARCFAGNSAAAPQHRRRIIGPMHRTAGKHIEAAKESHRLGPARQENFETAGRVRSCQDNGGSKTGNYHTRIIA